MNNRYMWFKEMSKRIDDCNTIVLYGSGIYGKRMLKELSHRLVLKKILFAVSELDEKNEIYGRELVDINQCKDPKMFIIITVGPSLNDEMKDNLNKIGIINYMELNEDIREYLRDNYDETKSNNRTEIQDDMIVEVFDKIDLLNNKINRLEELYKQIDGVENLVLKIEKNVSNILNGR